MTTNNLMSNIMSEITPPTPEVGMGATACYYTDRHAFTIVRVSKSGKVFWMRRDNVKRLDFHGMSDGQEYEYTTDPYGKEFRVSLRSDGKFKMANSHHVTVLVGVRKEYYDYSF